MVLHMGVGVGEEGGGGEPLKIQVIHKKGKDLPSFARQKKTFQGKQI